MSDEIDWSDTTPEECDHVVGRLLKKAADALDWADHSGCATPKETRRAAQVYRAAATRLERAAPGLDYGGKLDRLFELAKSQAPNDTPEELREQAISFAYGNTKLSNPNITRAMVESAYDELQRERASGDLMHRPQHAHSKQDFSDADELGVRAQGVHQNAHQSDEGRDQSGDHSNALPRPKNKGRSSTEDTLSVMTDNPFAPGIYRHYKGGTYTALMLVAHHETREPMVLYVSHTTGNVQVRELGIPGNTLNRSRVDAWNDEVVWPEDETRRPRFVLVRGVL